MEIFPGEIESTYFSPYTAYKDGTPSKKSSGILWEHYNYIKSNLRAQKILKSKKESQKTAVYKPCQCMSYYRTEAPVNFEQ